MQAGAEPVPGYSLVRRLGRGGFGEVWEALAPGGIRIALKFIHLETREGNLESRSLEVIRNIRHPHLLDIQFAVRMGEFLILAMPLCDQSLRDRLLECTQRGRRGLPVGELLGYMDELAQAVDFLNEPCHPTADGGRIAVQHRDIKPHNIFLVGGSARLADFGMVKVLEASVAEHSGGMSPSYVAPEQVEGKVSDRSDQYSLAVTYYQLRTGRLPYEGTLNSILLGHLCRVPDLSGLSGEEQAVVARALAKRPDDRWPSCREFVDRLKVSVATGHDEQMIPQDRTRTLDSTYGSPSVRDADDNGVTNFTTAPEEGYDLLGAALRARERAEGERRDELPPPPRRRRAVFVGVGALACLMAVLLMLLFWDTRAHRESTLEKKPGAPRIESAGKREAPPHGTVGIEPVLEAILRDVRMLPAGDRAFARYLSLNHLLAAGLSADELELHRAALAKAINHLSREREIMRPRPIEPTRTVFHIDLRTLGWDKRPFERIVDDQAVEASAVNRFDLVLLEYPYGVIAEGSAPFDHLADEFLRPAGQVRPIPFVRADWLMTAAMQSPLYEDLLGLHPQQVETDDQLKQDTERFTTALHRAMGEPAAREPLVGVTRRFREAPLSLAIAASELGLSDPRELQAALLGPELAGLGLSALASGGSIPRGRWEDVFDRVASALGLGAPIVPLDGLTRREFRPAAPRFDLELRTSKPDNVFSPGDALFILVVNRSNKDLFIELIGTSARGRKVILVPAGTVVKAGEQFRFPPSGTIMVQRDRGKEQITVFASDTSFPAGDLLRGVDVRDRVVHAFPPDPSTHPLENARIVKKTIEVETR
jgi:hypothetical protein